METFAGLLAVMLVVFVVVLVIGSVLMRPPKCEWCGRRADGMTRTSGGRVVNLFCGSCADRLDVPLYPIPAEDDHHLPF